MRETGPPVTSSDPRRLLSRLDWTADTLGETVLQCRPLIPGDSGLEMIENHEASVRFNVVEAEYYEYEYEADYDYQEQDRRDDHEEIVLTDDLHHDEPDGDATRPEALPEQLPHDIEPSESLDAISSGPRTLTASSASSRSSVLHSQTYIQPSHWSSSYNTALSLVESFRVVKYFHALKGPIIGALSVATPAVLCHKEPARRKNTPY